MIALIVLLMSFNPSTVCVTPPCEWKPIWSYGPMNWECVCPTDDTPDGTGAEIKFAPDPDPEAWEIREMGDWLCVRKPKREGR